MLLLEWVPIFVSVPAELFVALALVPTLAASLVLIIEPHRDRGSGALPVRRSASTMPRGGRWLSRRTCGCGRRRDLGRFARGDQSAVAGLFRAGRYASLLVCARGSARTRADLVPEKETRQERRITCSARERTHRSAHAYWTRMGDRCAGKGDTTHCQFPSRRAETKRSSECEL